MSKLILNFATALKYIINHWLLIFPSVGLTNLNSYALIELNSDENNAEIDI